MNVVFKLVHMNHTIEQVLLLLIILRNLAFYRGFVMNLVIDCVKWGIFVSNDRNPIQTGLGQKKIVKLMGGVRNGHGLMCD